MSVGSSQANWAPTASLEVLRARANVLGQIRQYFLQADVLEVQTPILGLRAVPDPDVACIEVPGYGFLQPSPEYFLKRLLAAGVPSCYQLGPVFRADEHGRLHRSEFTMLEWYRLGFDHHQLMQDVCRLVDLLLGESQYQFSHYSDLVGDLNVPRDVLDLRFSDACSGLRGRHFVLGYPADQAALARIEPQRADLAARFELVIDGVEIANGYWELTDLQEHLRRFDEDQQERLNRNLPRIEPDRQFFAALEHGLPDCAGVALGVDRLLMLALGKSDLGQVMAFG